MHTPELEQQVRNFLNLYVTDEKTTESIIREWLDPNGMIYAIDYNDTAARSLVEAENDLDYIIDDASLPVCLIIQS